jgi:hypothetical protein
MTARLRPSPYRRHTDALCKRIKKLSNGRIAYKIVCVILSFACIVIGSITQDERMGDFEIALALGSIFFAFSSIGIDYLLAMGGIHHLLDKEMATERFARFKSEGMKALRVSLHRNGLTGNEHIAAIEFSGPNLSIVDHRRADITTSFDPQVAENLLDSFNAVQKKHYGFLWRFAMRRARLTCEISKVSAHEAIEIAQQASQENQQAFLQSLAGFSRLRARLLIHSASLLPG